MRIRNSLVLIGFSILLTGCWKTEYTRLVERELSKGVQVDSLFLGLRFGMTRQEFFDHCMDLNRQHLTTVGYKNSSVLYTLTYDSAVTIDMHFFPDFKEEKIYKMPTIFTYKNWSPFDRNTQSDSLLVKVKGILEEWYGSGFIKVEKDEGKDFAFVKVDGNRQIVLFRENDMDVKAVFTDLLVENKTKK